MRSFFGSRRYLFELKEVRILCDVVFQQPPTCVILLLLKQILFMFLNNL